MNEKADEYNVWVKTWTISDILPIDIGIQSILEDLDHWLYCLRYVSSATFACVNVARSLHRQRRYQGCPNP